MIVWWCPVCKNQVLANEHRCPFCGWMVRDIEKYTEKPDNSLRPTITEEQE